MHLAGVTQKVVKRLVDFLVGYFTAIPGDSVIVVLQPQILALIFSRQVTPSVRWLEEVYCWYGVFFESDHCDLFEYKFVDGSLETLEVYNELHGRTDVCDCCSGSFILNLLPPLLSLLLPTSSAHA